MALVIISVTIGAVDKYRSPGLRLYQWIDSTEWDNVGFVC